ncbi:MAG: hypothetical protein JXB39_03615 [Deltaproteobacteria bacterium]|nr:hypothetical protein [Deltaproteobacteria bacterium]
MLLPFLALLLTTGPAEAYPPQGAVNLATTGLVLAPVGALVLGGLAAGDLATDPEGPVLGLSTPAALTSLPLLAAGPALLTTGSLRAQTVLEHRGRHVGSTSGWLSVACYVGALAIPELMRTPDGDYGAASDATVHWTRGVLYAASYAAGVAQYVQVRKAWIPVQKAAEQRALEWRFERRSDDGDDSWLLEEPPPEPPEPPNPEPPLPVASWALVPLALPGGGGGLALTGSF